MIWIKVLFWISACIIVWAMAGYSLSMKFLAKLFKRRKLVKDYTYQPTVTVMVVAHNEEQVIQEKMENMLVHDYPATLVNYVIASDFSTDRTNDIVRDFIANHPTYDIQLHESQEHKGKTNAQNEAQKLTTGEILVMTDANAMFEPNAITELVAAFTSDSIAYVTGKLQYRNAGENKTASSESTYWEGDLNQRLTESNIQTITAGNGAIYACRNADYHDFSPIQCHDSSMPLYYASIGKRAIYNPDACAYEKAGEVNDDEFKRKVRMNRIIPRALLAGLKSLNVFKYKWFTYFFFGHRTCRYLLWLSHTLLLLCSFLLWKAHWFYAASAILQTLFYVIALLFINGKTKNKLLHLMSYYLMTILAQWLGIINCLTGRAKPVWEKAESTR